MNATQLFSEGTRAAADHPVVPASPRMILHKFVARSTDQVGALERALGSGNAPELARGAKTLKGLASDLSAEALRARAESLQQAAEQGALGEAKTALVRTREEIDRCVEAAGRLLEQSD